MCYNLASMSYLFNYYSGLNAAFKTAYRCLVVIIRSTKVGQVATIYVNEEDASFLCCKHKHMMKCGAPPDKF